MSTSSTAAAGSALSRMASHALMWEMAQPISPRLTGRVQYRALCHHGTCERVIRPGMVASVASSGASAQPAIGRQPTSASRSNAAPSVAANSS